MGMVMEMVMMDLGVDQELEISESARLLVRLAVNAMMSPQNVVTTTLNAQHEIKAGVTPYSKLVVNISQIANVYPPT